MYMYMYVISFQQPSQYTLQQQVTSQTGLTVGITKPNSTAGTSVLGGGGLTGLGRGIGGTIGGVQNSGAKRIVHVHVYELHMLTSTNTFIS